MLPPTWHRPVPAPAGRSANPTTARPQNLQAKPGRRIHSHHPLRLRTELADGKLAFVRVGGEIEGIVNPTLQVAERDIVQAGLVNNDRIEHDLVFPDFKAGTDRVNCKGASTDTVFRADKAREFPYSCSCHSHRPAGHGGQARRGRRPQGAERRTARGCEDREGPRGPARPLVLQASTHR